MKPALAISGLILACVTLAGCGSEAFDQIPAGDNAAQPSAQAATAPPQGTVSYASSCTLVSSNPAWGPSWAGTEMPEVKIANTGDVTLSIVYLTADYTNASGVIVGTDNPGWSPTVLYVPAGGVAEASPADAGWTPPSGAVACSLDTAASDIQAVSPEAP